MSEYNRRKEENMKKKNKIKRNIFIVTVILIILVFFSVIFALINSISKKIITGTFINNINVSGLTRRWSKRKTGKYYGTDEK